MTRRTPSPAPGLARPHPRPGSRHGVASAARRQPGAAPSPNRRVRRRALHHPVSPRTATPWNSLVGAPVAGCSLLPADAEGQVRSLARLPAASVRPCCSSRPDVLQRRGSASRRQRQHRRRARGLLSRHHADRRGGFTSARIVDAVHGLLGQLDLRPQLSPSRSSTPAGTARIWRRLAERSTWIGRSTRKPSRPPSARSPTPWPSAAGSIRRNSPPSGPWRPTRPRACGWPARATQRGADTYLNVLIAQRTLAAQQTLTTTLLLADHQPHTLSIRPWVADFPEVCQSLAREPQFKTYRPALQVICRLKCASDDGVPI